MNIPITARNAVTNIKPCDMSAGSNCPSNKATRLIIPIATEIFMRVLPTLSSFKKSVPDSTCNSVPIATNITDMPIMPLIRPPHDRVSNIFILAAMIAILIAVDNTTPATFCAFLQATPTVTIKAANIPIAHSIGLNLSRLSLISSMPTPYSKISMSATSISQIPLINPSMLSTLTNLICFAVMAIRASIPIIALRASTLSGSVSIFIPCSFLSAAAMTYTAADSNNIFAAPVGNVLSDFISAYVKPTRMPSKTTKAMPTGIISFVNLTEANTDKAAASIKVDAASDMNVAAIAAIPL